MMSHLESVKKAKEIFNAHGLLSMRSKSRWFDVKFLTSCFTNRWTNSTTTQLLTSWAKMKLFVNKIKTFDW